MAEADVLIVGLGNPGAEYAGTRHNLGEACVRELARRLGVEVSRRRWKALVGFADLASPDWALSGRAWLMLPQTFMNLSGAAVASAVRDLALSPGSVWVVHDELDLPLCRLRIRLGGSAAGNNGVRSIIASLGTDRFWRFRIGVGKPPSSRRGVSYVLGRWSKAEAAVVPAVTAGVASALEEALRSGIVRARDLYNRAGSLGCDELA